MAVPAEDDDGWQVEFEWDEGQRQRVLHFPSEKDAELWIADPNLLSQPRANTTRRGGLAVVVN